MASLRPLISWNRLNIKMSPSMYINSHYKDKTVSRPRQSLEWNGPLLPLRDTLWICPRSVTIHGAQQGLKEGTSLTNTLMHRQNSHHLGGNVFKDIFFINENDRISIKVSLKFITQDRIDNKSTLVQKMDCFIYTYICSTHPECVNTLLRDLRSPEKESAGRWSLDAFT